MSSSQSRFVVDPTRVLIRGDRERETVGLSLRIGDEGVEIRVRTGAVSEETIELGYGEIDEVDVVEELAYRLVLRAGSTTYEVSNVTASDDEIEAIVGYVRTRMRRARRGASDGNTVTPDGDQRAAATDGSQPAGAAADTEGTGSGAEELKRWVQLHEEGVISAEELEQKKRELL